MNYRHAFHAGGVADCMKHAILVWLLRALARKPAPFFVLDTHAGTGRTDLASGPAARTGEWRTGIGRLLDQPPPPLADYLGVVRALGLPAGTTYPGSPAIARALLRPGDRLACCELHPEDVAPLRALFAGDRQVGVHHRDGYEAVRGLLPPPERRGLVLIDPPFEQPDEFSRLVAASRTVAARFPTGLLAMWYPIKHRTPVRAFHEALRTSGVRDLVAAELLLTEPVDPGRLAGCGLVVASPPYRFLTEVGAILAALRERFGGIGAEIGRLTDE